MTHSRPTSTTSTNLSPQVGSTSSADLLRVLLISTTAAATLPPQMTEHMASISAHSKANRTAQKAQTKAASLPPAKHQYKKPIQPDVQQPAARGFKR